MSNHNLIADADHTFKAITKVAMRFRRDYKCLSKSLRFIILGIGVNYITSQFFADKTPFD